MLDAAEGLSIKLKPAPTHAPVTPLGMYASKYYVLTAAGELRVCGASLESGQGVFDLFVGGDAEDGIDATGWLVSHFPPKSRKPKQFEYDAKAAGQWIMAACAQRGVYDPSTGVRRQGVWRDSAGDAVAHTGGELVWPGGVSRDAGCLVDGHVYPVAPGERAKRSGLIDESAAPERPAEAAEIRDMLARMRDGWRWERDLDAHVFMGWIGLAALGGFPNWRPHLWVSAKWGSGKSGLLETASALLGPVAHPVKSGATEANIRQKTDGQSRAHLIDEGEAENGVSNTEKLVELFRRASDKHGGTIGKGGMDHQGRDFSINGSACIVSINPVALKPQDRSRFVMLRIKKLRKGADVAAHERLVADAGTLGRRLWLRMLARSVEWDDTVAVFRRLVMKMGGDHRTAETIGAILTGYHLLTQDRAPEGDDLDLAQEIAEPLVEAALAAAEDDNEGRLCWNRVLQSTVQVSGKWLSISDLIIRAMKPGSVDNKLLGVYGLKAFPEKNGAPPYVAIVSGQHVQLDRIFQGTRWTGAVHANSLLMLDGVDHARGKKGKSKNVWIGGSGCKALIIPKKHMPIDDDDAPEDEE